MEPETPESNICNVDLIYFINSNSQKEGKLNFVNIYLNNLSYKTIKSSFFNFLIEKEDKYYLYDERQVDICFIRYFDGEGWILLEEDNAILFEGELKSNNQISFPEIKFMIKANIKSNDKMNMLNNIKDINDMINSIEGNIIPNYDEGDEGNFCDTYRPNLIMLIANPLMDDKKELRTMNDFNIIPSKIYKLLYDNDYLNCREFLPLTTNILIDILSDEKNLPIILHLICKSTYIVENNKNNQFTNLIDEDNKNKSKYNLEFINKEKLEKIFNSNENIKENIKKITLIISTPLAEDVYELFNNFGFKNLLVQHTTLADVNYIADFNLAFYQELVDSRYSKSINELYEKALKIPNSTQKNIFCCCFHKHKNNCELIKNLKDELYNDNAEKDIKSLEESLPHFYHLFPYCKGIPICHDIILNKYDKIIESEEKPKKKYLIDSFSFHSSLCVEVFYSSKEKFEEIKIKYKINENKKRYKTLLFYNLCCCNKNAENHTINSIFFKDFSEQEKNNKITFRKSKRIPDNKIIPNFEALELLVGQNKIIFDVIQFFYSNKLNYYIHGDSFDNLNMLEKIIIEYYKEKNYCNDDEDVDLIEQELNLIKKMNSTSNLGSNKEYFDKSLDIIKRIPFNSEKKIFHISKSQIFDFKIIYLDDKLIFDEINTDNKIFFIYVYKAELMEEARMKIGDKKIVWLYIDIPKNIKNDAEFKYFKNMKKLKEEINKKKNKIFSPNLYIQFQNEKALLNDLDLIKKKFE